MVTSVAAGRWNGRQFSRNLIARSAAQRLSKPGSAHTRTFGWFASLEFMGQGGRP
ncbi:MAG: hypothetical protein Hens2KO_06390 [Henriciella sp.]